MVVTLLQPVMDLNDTVNDFKETKVKRVKSVSYPKSKLSRNKRQKTSSEVDQKGSQKEKNNSQNNNKSEDKCLKSEVIVETTSSYFSSKNPLSCSKSSVYSDINIDTDSSSETLTAVSKPLKNESEFSNLSVKTESDVQVTTSITPTIGDCPQNVVVSCEQTVLQENVCTTTETSEEEWWCIFCKSSLPSEERDAHIKSCVLQFEYRTSVKTGSCHEEMEQPSSLHCEVCKADITHLSLQDRNAHVNNCIDQQTADKKLPLASHESVPEARPEIITISECPVCGKQYTSLEARLIHIKKCCKKHKMEPRQVIVALQLQEKHALERISLGLPPLQIKPSTVKTNVNTRQRKRKIPLQVQVKSDPDLQIAMALSLSLEEEEKRKQEALGLLLGESDNLVYDTQTDRSNRLVELKPPAENQKPRRAKPRSKKNDLNKPVPVLLLRTEEERLKLLQGRVSAIIASGSPKKTPPETSAILDPETSQPNVGVAYSELRENSCDSEKSVKLCELWTLSGLAPEKDAYYVPELQEWVSHSEVVAGSKLKNLSQVPGHKISHEFSFEYSTFYTHDSQGLSSSQNCSAKSLMDIPSTQEMLDVITGDEACASKMPWDAHQNLEILPTGYGDFGGEVKNDGFFPELKKNMNPNAIIPVIDSLRKLVGNPWMSDVSIAVSEQRNIPAHKLLLIPRCPTIEKELQELQNGMSLLDWSCTSLKAALEFLHFIYTGFCQLDGPFRKEISALFYRYDMAEAYETLKNDSRPNSEEGSCAGDVSVDGDVDVFQENQGSAENSDVVMNQDTALECHDIYNIHCKSDLVTERNSLNFTSPKNNYNSKGTSDCETEKGNANISVKRLFPVTSPESYHFNQHENSSNSDIEILREEKFNSFQSANETARLSQHTQGSSLKENHDLKNSKILSHEIENSSKGHLLLISDEEIKRLCSPIKEQHFSTLKVSAGDLNVCHPDQSNKLSLSLEEKINNTEDSKLAFGEHGLPRKAKSLPSMCGNKAVLNISPFKHNMTMVKSKKSPASCSFSPAEVQRNFSGNHGLKISADVGVSESCDLLNTSDSEELFTCDSDEEITTACSSNVVSHICSSIRTMHSLSSPQEKPSSHCPEMNIVTSQKPVSKSRDQEIVIVNEVSNTNISSSASYVSKQEDFQSLGTEIDDSYQNSGSHKVCNEAFKRTCESSDDEYFPDLIIDNRKKYGNETLLSTPTSSKSNYSAMRQKRKSSSNVSPVLLNTTHASFKKSKVGVEKSCSFDHFPVLNVEGDHYRGVDKGSSYRRDISVNGNSDHLKISNISTIKSDMLSYRMSFPALSSPTCADNIDDCDSEVDGLCAGSRNTVPDMWDGLDDDGFKDKVVCGEHNTSTVYNDFQLLTPLKSSRDRPPTPHPSSARKSAAKKLSFVDEDVSPSSSPLYGGTDVIDLDSSPISVRPLAERLGAMNQKKVSPKTKTTGVTKLCTTPKHKKNKHNSKKEVYPVSHAMPHCVTPDMKTSAKSKTIAHNFTVSTSPITPMPSFQEMVTPELKDQLKKYGIRALPRKKAVSLLTHIYDETHPWQAETEPDCVSRNPVTYARSAFRPIASSPVKVSPEKPMSSPQKVKKSEKQKVSKSTKPASKKENKKASNSKVSRDNMKDCQQDNCEEGELNISSSQTSSLSESSDFPEESVLRPEKDSDDELITPSQSESLEQRINNYIFSDESLYTKILMYEPVNLPDFQLQLKQQGIKVGHSKLMDYLDEKCITFTLPRSEKQQKKQQARSQRFRKRVIAKLSQKPSSQAS